MKIHFVLTRFKYIAVDDDQLMLIDCEKIMFWEKKLKTDLI